MKGTAFWAVLVLAAAPTGTGAQELVRRVSEVDEGTVRLTYPARPGVEICDQGIRMGRERMIWRSRWGEEEATNCRAGPVEIELSVRGGSVRGVDVIRRLRDRTERALDLGSFPAEEATELLLEIARTGGRGGRGEEEAVFPAALADVQDLWRELLALAKDRGVEADVRTSALFWVGQEAADAVTQGLADVALDEGEDQDVREAAVFALSQRPDDEAVPILMQIARTAPHIQTRRSAMFWLAQSKDERVYDFFEEILLGRGGG